MNRFVPAQRRLSCLLLIFTLALPTTALAKAGAHVHGLVKLNVAVEAKTLTVQLEAPLDSLLGFEHRPRTAAQKQAADTLLKQMNAGAALVRPDAAALCKPTKTSVESAILQSPPPTVANDAKSAVGARTAKEDEHADLDASFEFSCEQPDKLGSIELGLFDAFKRIQKIEVQVAGAKGQSKQTLKRPEKLLKLRP